jgi:hybrid cluster-associated redox disulfide protein
MVAKRKSPVRKTKKAKLLITPKSIIGEVVMKHPLAAEIMMERGLHCIGCHISPFETIEQGAAAHGMPKKEVAAMVAEINKAVSKKR